ncbi:vesicle-associated membrane protein [Ramaria rubella]|nr:vesicle-associated membrane protein [Ramaria rubella]KAF8578133.1 vesicle-associated membrane protein [Ramaria rubella]
MSLIHALVARGSTILAEASTDQHDFSQAVQTILSKIPPNNSKLTYVWEQYLFHYVSEGGLTYLVMADDAVGRRMPFSFLATVQRQFVAAHPSPPASTHALQQTFGPTLSELLTQFNSQQIPAAGSSQNPDALYQARNELDQVKDIMVHNVEQILSRGERIELLVDKTDTMAGQSLAFRRGAKATRRKMFWRNNKVVALGISVGLLFVYMFVAQFCGAALNQCGNGKA